MDINEFADLFPLSLSPEELLKILLENGYSLEESVPQVKKHYPGTSAEEMCRIIKGMTKKEGGTFTKEEARQALLKADYPSEEVQKAIDAVYPGTAYAAAFCQDAGSYAHMYANHIPAYNFGTGDFTLEAYIKPDGPGTVLACKGTPGGYGNGGFLLVYNADGTFKFATDDGMGFYEVVSEKQTVTDGNWHHILAVRENAQLYIYFDFNMCNVHSRTNRFTPLNVNNSQPFTVATTYQVQEPYQHYAGKIDDVCVWKCAKIYRSEEEYRNTKRDSETADLCGYWNFDEQNGADCSAVQNPLKAEGKVTYVARS